MREGDIVRTITIRHKVEGVSEAVASNKAIGASHDDLRAAQLRQVVTSEESAKRQASVARSFELMEMRGNSLRKAIADLDAAQVRAQRAFDQGAVSYDRAAASLVPFIERANRAKEAQDKLSASQEAAKRVTQNRVNDVTGVSAMASRNTAGRAEDIAAYGKELDRVREKFNPLFAAGQQYRRTIEEINQSVRSGAISEKEASAAREVAKTTVQNQVQALREGAKAGRLMAGEMANLSFQLNDVVTGLALGQSPFMIMAQQGGQVYQILANSRSGVSGAIKEIGESLAGLVPAAGRFLASTTGVVAGIAAIGAAFAAAGVQFSSGQREINKALSGSGAASGLTRGGINQIAERSSSTFGLSVSEARSAAAAFASTGKLYGDNVERATQLTKQFAQAMDLGVGDAAKKLASDLQDPVRAALEWNKTLGFLDAATLNHIRSLDAMGMKQDAIRALMAAATPAVKKQAENVDVLTRAWDAATNFVSNYFQQSGAAFARTAERLTGADFGGFSDEERLQGARATQSSLRNVDTTGLDPQSMEAYAEAVRRANSEVERLEKKLDDISSKRRLGELSLDVDAFSRAVMGSLDQIDKLSQGLAQIAQLREARANTGRGLTVEQEAAAQVARVQLATSQDQLAVEQRKAQVIAANAEAYRGVSVSTAQTLAQLNSHLPVAQALTTATQMKAQYEATYRDLLAQGKSEIDAQAIAAAQLVQAQAQATASVMQQVQALKDQNAMIQARANGTEATTAAAIAYRNAIDAGADSTAAAALKAETLKNHLLQASSAVGGMAVQLDNLDWSEFDAQVRLEETRNNAGYTANFDVPKGKQYDSDIDLNPFDNNGRWGGGWGSRRNPGSVPIVANTTLEAMQREYASYLSGSKNKEDQILGLQIQISDLAQDLAQHPENAWKIASLQRSIDELRNSTDELRNSTDENTAALNKVTLNPLYTEGRDALKIGYTGAARGLDFTVQGGIPGVDSVPIHIMAQQGERVQVTPAGEVSNDNSRTSNVTIIQNFGGSSSSPGLRRSKRQAMQGLSQGIAASY